MQPSLMQAFVALCVIGVFALFIFCYSTWQRSRPMLFTGLFFLMIYVNILVGNTMPNLTSEITPSWFHQWATQDAFAHGIWGQEHWIFLVVMTGILALCIPIWHRLSSWFVKMFSMIPKSELLPIAGVFSAATFVLFIVCFGPVGENLKVAGINMLTPTKIVVGKTVGGAAEGFLEGTGNLASQTLASINEAKIKRFKQEIAKLKSANKNFKPTIDEVIDIKTTSSSRQSDNNNSYYKSDNKQSPTQKQNQNIDSDKKSKDKRPPLLRYGNKGKKGPSND